jgi:GNAT superfamily N-acetyltransferase
VHVVPLARGQARGRKGRPWKERLVREGKAHAALVFDGDAAVAWCQYGSPEDLPRIYHRKEWEAGLTGEPPAYRMTCIFVDRDYRRKGVAAVAVRGALDLIAKAGGGVVEGYPHDLQGEKIRSQFLYSATRSLFEEVGFSYERPKGKKNCVMAHSRFSRRSLLTGSRRVIAGVDSGSRNLVRNCVCTLCRRTFV